MKLSHHKPFNMEFHFQHALEKSDKKYLLLYNNPITCDMRQLFKHSSSFWVAECNYSLNGFIFTIWKLKIHNPQPILANYNSNEPYIIRFNTFANYYLPFAMGNEWIEEKW